MTLPLEYNSLVQLWSLHPPTYKEASSQLMEHQRCHISTDFIREGIQHMTFTSSYGSSCKVCTKSHSHGVCCKCPNATKPHSVDSCWKLHPEQRPIWAKERENNTATGSAVVNFATAAGSRNNRYGAYTY
ncbi:hypothetical protein EJ02DRAFT_485432 [Clathrospora elynae]|uniref:Uncharacterized protein n=1 Tax=Clathrospora elynae TaxID=706981 RepID=A0A6A5S636_9PLEO|nr:hypothetical protein EJ02DRAFT_485432 [Clathrospora elynae]